MATIHMTLQGKGGVGKSMVSVTTAQYMAHKNTLPLCIDTDPVNATFEGFQALQVKRVEIMDGDEINTRHFDQLIELLAATETDVVIDNGASSFVPLSHYLISNDVPALLQEMGHNLVVHTIITGGQALPDTINGFAQLVNQFPEETRFVVWQNPYWGQITFEGKGLEQMKVYRDNKERVAALISIPELKQETYGKDLSDMLRERLTFIEALKSPEKSIMTRQRLKIIRDGLFAQLDNAMVI
ncbi:conjugal transfer protein TraL [Legionella geestiana]|uniref:Conjugal transfer protein TraL n=1 Tax=Legionella geestiana TaxID=45065 RepID=A0A0W0U6P3_9GAMM|nr:ArsA-related P-loop ATPase [Legionella geestiana]KTD03714.1 conjugal transfer protein TraL [Legionella geestiana]QBS11519.1 conjugal transfer protein TraL [Legionella geestiana]STX53816.1 traL protein [Legionella geestiana]